MLNQKPRAYSVNDFLSWQRKKELVLQAVKGQTFQMGLTGPSFQLFDSDLEVLVQPFGKPGGYQTVRPF